MAVTRDIQHGGARIVALLRTGVIYSLGQYIARSSRRIGAKSLLRKEWLWLAIIAVVFVLIRLPGTDLPLHQDEYKWPRIVNPAVTSSTEIPHPPLSQFIYRRAGEVVGFDTDFRYVPLFFGLLNLFLLFYYLRRKFGRSAGFFGASIFTLSYFSILASLMVDTDGQIMPFFFLLSLIFYEKFRRSYFLEDGVGLEGDKWLALSATAIFFILGIFIKVSFALCILAIAGDFLYHLLRGRSRRDVVNHLFRFGIGAVIFVFVVVALLILSQRLFPFFNLGTSVKYWEHFANTDRNIFQTLIQTIKDALYASPFLVLVPLFVLRADFKRLIPQFLFIIFGLFFYLVAFDFSIGALDRYLQFAIVPLTIITAVVLSGEFRRERLRSGKAKEHFLQFIILGVVLGVCLFLFNLIEHSVPALHPKSAWVSRVLSLEWDFLYPFSGGSGPLGFYASFVFLAYSWIVSAVFVCLGLIRKNLRIYLLALIIPVSLFYNGVFAQEYLFGHLFGSSSELLERVTEYIRTDESIQHVTVYNDNGGNEIQEIGKYRKRLYTDPAFDLDEKISSLNKYKEHYLEIDIPRIDRNSVYRRYLDYCAVVYSETDRYVSARVYDCRRAPSVVK